MKLQFETLDYQLNAVNAAVNMFIGQPNASSEFALRSQNDLRFISNLPLQISDEQLQQNLANQQNSQKIDRTLLSENGKNFTVEMETGTGKTYVYLRTIFELNKQYGWQKFVIWCRALLFVKGCCIPLTSRKHILTMCLISQVLARSLNIKAISFPV